MNKPRIRHSQRQDPNRPRSVAITLPRIYQRNDYGVGHVVQRECAGDAPLVEILGLEMAATVPVVFSFVESEDKPRDQKEECHVDRTQNVELPFGERESMEQHDVNR